MKKTKKALASLAIAGMALTMVPFNVFANGSIPTRLAGNTAEQTAVAISAQTGWTGTAILASSASYGMVDALTSGPLAKALNAPILLQEAGAVLNAATKAELTRLNVKTVYVTSGTSVISQAVLDQVAAMGITVVPLGGYDRFETSVNIAKKMVSMNPATKVAVAFGWLNQDALSIASIASHSNQPILLTEKDSIPASVSAFLAANAGIVSTDVIGGTSVVSDAVKAALPNATRHAGNSAYDTNNQVIQDFASSLNFDNVFVANGETAIDALSGAPLAAMTKSPIVLTDGVTSPAVAAFTYSKANTSTVTTALGGTVVVPEQVRLDIAAGKVAPVDGLSITSVSALDDTNTYLQIDFSKAITTGLEPSNITIQDAKTGARYGVKTVTLAANGLSAQLELFSNADNTTKVLKDLTDYTVTVQANGMTLTATFNRAAFTESRVIDINVADKEVKALNEKTGALVTLTVPAGVTFDYQASLGEVVDLWYNADNEITKSSIPKVESKTDAIEITDSNTIKLLGEDEKYDVSTETYDNSTTNTKFKFYLDGEDKTSEFESGDYVSDKYNFAKVGYDKSGDIEFVSAYSLADFLLVDSVDGTDVVGINGDSSGSFDAEDATIVKAGKVISLSDLSKGDLLFFSDAADAKDGYAVVYNNAAVTGDIENVYADSIDVDGDNYQFKFDGDVFAYETPNSIYLDKDGKVGTVDSDAAEELQAAGPVALYTDPAGNLIYISGDVANVVSNTKVATLTDTMIGYNSARDKVEIEAVTQEGDAVSYDISLESLDTIAVDGTDHDIDNDAGSTSDWKASLVGTSGAYTGLRLHDNTTGSSTGTDIIVNFTGANVAADTGSLVKLTLDDNGTLKELGFFSGTSLDGGYGTFTSLEAGDTYIDGNKLTSDTIMFDATDDTVNTDAEDYVVSAFGDYKGSEITSGNYIYNDDQEVVAVWYDVSDDQNNTYDEAVVTKVLRDTDDKVVSLTVYAGGKEQTFAVDKVGGFTSTTSLKKGDVVVLQFDEDNAELVKGISTSASDPVLDLAKQYQTRVFNGAVLENGVDVGNKTVKVGATTYKLADKGLVLDATDPSDITVESLSDLKGETNVTAVLDATTGLYAKFFVIGAGEGTGETLLGTDGSVAYISVASDEIQLDKADGTKPVYPVIGAAKTTLALINTAFADGADIDLSVVIENGNVVGFDNIIATVTDATEITNADAITGIERIVLGSDITASPSLTKLVDVYFGSYTLTGNLAITTSTAGTINLVGTGTPAITGTLTVIAPNATVNNNVAVGGTVTIDDVAAGTWNENAVGNTLVVDDANATVNINSNVASLTVTAASKVKIADTSTVTTFVANGAVAVTGADNIVTANVNIAGVTLDAEPENLTATAAVEIGGTDVTVAELALVSQTAAVEAAEAELTKVDVALAADLAVASKRAILQEVIDDAQAAYDEVVLTDVADGTAKTALIDRLEVIQDAIDVAQDVHDVVVAPTLSVSTSATAPVITPSERLYFDLAGVLTPLASGTMADNTAVVGSGLFSGTGVAKITSATIDNDATSPSAWTFAVTGAVTGDTIIYNDEQLYDCNGNPLAGNTVTATFNGTVWVLTVTTV